MAPSKSPNGASRGMVQPLQAAHVSKFSRSGPKCPKLRIQMPQYPEHWQAQSALALREVRAACIVEWILSQCSLENLWGDSRGQQTPRPAPMTVAEVVTTGVCCHSCTYE